MNRFKPILTPKPFYKVDRIFISMNIREGALTAPPEQENIIRDFLKRFHDTFERVIEERGGMDWYFFKKLVSRFEVENLSVKRGIKLTVKFIFKSKVRAKPGSENDPEARPDAGCLDTLILGKHYQIEMNMFYCFQGLEESSFITGMDWTEFYKTFVHEYKHFLQSLRTLKSKKKIEDDETTPYFNKPHEQQAWAEGYLEKIRRELNTNDLNVILDFLRKKQLSMLPELQQLKTTNPLAWKAIMKQVVLAAQRDLQ